MLIIGVLFLVALLAVGGAVWLSIGERQENSKVAAPAVAAPGQPTTAASATVGQHATAESPTAAPATVPLEPDEMLSPAPVAPTVPTAYGEHQFSALNGQFFELAAELRALHHEAQDVERRLGILTEMVNRIEQEYSEVSLETR